jgi:Cd2+/Zn2+-exporting ATPase
MIEVDVTRVGEDTTLGRVRQLILAAEQTKLPITKIIDRYAGYYTPVVLMLVSLVWFFTDDWNRVVNLLVMSCPCAFILATPTAMVAALSAAARQGILVKNVVDLEAASRIDAMIFDKTGTLTTGELGVVRLSPQEGVSPSELVYAAAGAERYSNHPAAAALIRLARETDVPITEADDFHEEAGQGVRARVDGEQVLSGRASWLESQGVTSDDLSSDHAQTSDGLSTIYVARGGRYLGWVGLSDQLRPEAAAAIQALRELKVNRVAMITGDRVDVAGRVAEQIGGCEFRAECLPQEKASYVRAFKEEGYHVAFVGDGVNDAPALSASDTGIAMGAAGSDVAIHSATVALMSNDLLRLPFLVKLSHGARRVVYQNLSVGGVFIIGGLIAAGMGLINTIVAVLMHNAGSLIVVFNSARLVSFGETPEPEPARTQRPVEEWSTGVVE